MKNTLASLMAGCARTLRAALTVAGLAALIMAAGCGGDDSNVNYPTQDPPADPPWFYTVGGTAANNVYVAGASGVMYHWDGADWTPVDLGTSRAVTEIWGPGDGSLYLCGHGGMIMRNTGGGWQAMTSGTTKDLYAIGSYQGQIHAVGFEGAAKRLSGSSWQDILPTAVIRNAQAGGAASDTLNIPTDTASLLTVNHWCIGGAYRKPDWRQTDIGRTNTDGMVLTADNPPEDLPAFDWQMRPLRGDQLALYEWVYCTTSDDATLANNYLGTSEGWLFQLVEDLDNPGSLVWSKYSVRITEDRGTGIRDMWLDGADLYMVTDGGRIVYRAADGEIRELYNGQDTLVSIWGASPAEFFVTGFMNETVLRCSYDPVADVFSAESITLDFPE